MNESFREILKSINLTYNLPGLGLIIVFISSCFLLFVAVMLSLRRRRSPKRKSLNPRWIGSLFLDYCLKKGWVSKEGSRGKGSKWYATERGKEELRKEFGITIDKHDS